jgi:hypothetical protein
MRWTCERDCGAGGSKEYGDAGEAARYAAAFDREDRGELGRRARCVGVCPPGKWWAVRDTRR